MSETVVSVDVPETENKASRRTCHFKQLGLNDGLPAAASPSLLNTKRVGMLAGIRARNGGSLGA